MSILTDSDDFVFGIIEMKMLIGMSILTLPATLMSIVHLWEDFERNTSLQFKMLIGRQDAHPYEHLHLIDIASLFRGFFQDAHMLKPPRAGVSLVRLDQCAMDQEGDETPWVLPIQESDEGRRSLDSFAATEFFPT